LDLLIIYSEAKKGALVSLATLLHEKGIRFVPWALPQTWGVQDSEGLVQTLKSTSHWLFLFSPADASHPASLFAAGYSVAVHERCFILDEEGKVPGYWKTLFNICRDFPTLVAALEDERQRWNLSLSRLEAQVRLVDRGLEVSNTAFVEAVRDGDGTSCELFLQAGFSPDQVNKKGVSVLCLAVRSAHVGVLRMLLDAGADLNLRSRDRENSPLMDAAAEGLTDLVGELIQRGADLSGVSRNGQNALVLAIGKGAQDAAALLLEAGADPFLADKLGMNACQYAQLLGRKEFLALMAEKFPDKV